MPIDNELPPSRLAIWVPAGQFVLHFLHVFGIRVDLEGLDALPALERLSLAGARLPEPPEAVLLDRVLQLVPASMLKAVERIVIVQTRGTARYGGSRRSLVQGSAQEARVREGDPGYGRRFSFFTTTVLHEVGHAIFDGVLSASQRDAVADDYFRFLDRIGSPPPGEPTEAGVQHFFVGHFMAALLGRGEPPTTAAQGRESLARLGLDLRWR